MDNDLGVNPFDQEEKPRSPILTIAIFGLALACCCAAFIGAFLIFKPDSLSVVEELFPSPTVTQTKTPIPTSTPNLTATQQVLGSTATSQAIEALATESISQWPIILSEPFDSNKNNWSVGSDNDEYADISREVKDGKYFWDVTAKKSFIAWVSPDLDAVSDFHLSVEIQRTSGSDQSDYGLIFREDTNSNLYYFGIDDENFFVLLNYDGAWSDMITTTRSTAILSGQTNRLTVIAEGSHFVFFINDQYVAELTDDRIQQGTTALAAELYDADLQATFEFDNFELRAP